MPRLHGLRRMAKRLQCVVVRGRVGSIPRAGDELAPPINRLLIMYCID